MTVRELIAALEKVENKDLDVIFIADFTGIVVDEVCQNNVYYGRDEENGCWVCEERECIVISQIKERRKTMNINEIYNYIDYTLLKPTATERDISKLCDTAIIKGCASVCIPSSYVSFVHEHFPDARICTVVGFPLGNSTINTKIAEAIEAIENGAKEIDMVINIGEFKNGNYDYIANELDSMCFAILMNSTMNSTAILKVIIETCYLTDEEIAIATRIVDESFADYVKTSTGFGTRGASFEDIEIMKANIRYGTKIKASGGIRTAEDMEKYIEMGCDRIGASVLP